MKRTIKFRAWDKDIKQMLYSINVNADGRMILEYGNYVASVSYPIMQYTGLNDKNGKEIYEGDIVEWHTQRSVVEWNTQYGLWHLYVQPSGSSKCQSQLLGNYPNAEVIGNIYEHQNLLQP